MIACGSGSLHRALETGGTTPRWDRAGGCDLARSDLLPASSSANLSLHGNRCSRFLETDSIDWNLCFLYLSSSSSDLLINYFSLPALVVRRPRCPSLFKSLLFDAGILLLPMDLAPL